MPFPVTAPHVPEQRPYMTTRPSIMLSSPQLARTLAALVLSCPAVALDTSLQDGQHTSEGQVRANASPARRILYSASKDKLVIHASPNVDPGVHDYTHKFGDAINSHKGQKMSNAIYLPNDDPPTPYDGEGITTWDDAHPAPDPLGDYRAWWNPRDGIPRHPVLIIEDMEIGYAKYVDYVLPNCIKILNKFREYSAPIIWTNWVRRADDNLYGALDRFYGPEGTTNEENPMFIYGKAGTDTLPALSPINDDEYTRTIRSLHLSKFADLDENGKLILFNLLKSWGIDTVVLTGAWTDDCILATVYDAVDKYDLDVIMVEDGVATSTLQHGNALKISRAGLCYVATTQDVLDLLDESFDTTRGTTKPYFNIDPSYVNRDKSISFFSRMHSTKKNTINSNVLLSFASGFASCFVSTMLVAVYFHRRLHFRPAFELIDTVA